MRPVRKYLGLTICAAFVSGMSLGRQTLEGIERIEGPFVGAPVTPGLIPAVRDLPVPISEPALIAPVRAPSESPPQ